MRFEFIADEHVKVKTFLRRHEISKGLLAKIKFSGGNIFVNHQPQNAVYLLDIGDRVTIDIPSEKGFESLKAVDKDLSFIYEDEHFLVLDKSAGVASIPSVNHSNTMANFVKAYYIRQDYENQQVHIVTRLDKDTSGLMLFAKHGYAHARLDKQLQKKLIEKRYYALVRGSGLLEYHYEIRDKGWQVRPYQLQGHRAIWRCLSGGYPSSYWADSSNSRSLFTHWLSAFG